MILREKSISYGAIDLPILCPPITLAETFVSKQKQTYNLEKSVVFLQVNCGIHELSQKVSVSSLM